MANRRRLSISLPQVEAEIEELRRRLAEAEAVRSYLLRTAAPFGVSEGESKAGTPRAQANWAERINDVLAADPGQRFTIHQIRERLSGQAPELASAADASSLLRATLNRYARTYDWRKERSGRAMLWYREADVV
jgi:hypothetical protein